MLPQLVQIKKHNNNNNNIQEFECTLNCLRKIKCQLKGTPSYMSNKKRGTLAESVTLQGLYMRNLNKFPM